MRHLAPRSERVRLDAVLPGQPGGPRSRNLPANLAEDAYDGLGWFVFIFHSCFVTAPKNFTRHFFCGTLVDED